MRSAAASPVRTSAIEGSDRSVMDSVEACEADCEDPRGVKKQAKRNKSTDPRKLTLDCMALTPCQSHLEGDRWGPAFEKSNPKWCCSTPIATA
jgi:hypothetical protein